MNKNSVKPTNQLIYYHDSDANACVLCGGDLGSVHFKGKYVCEECLDMVKDMY